jgi:ferredoxin-NADP reductase
MCKNKLITGIKVTQQMSRAYSILNSQVIPREILFQIRKKEGNLSPDLIKAIKRNA